MTDEGGTDGSPRDSGAPLLPAIAEHPRGSEVPAAGGKPARWLIRQGQYITVGELFVFGTRRCSCWALYSPRAFSSAKSNTSCRARRATSSCRTPRGNGTSTQASLVWTGEPRAMHVCSARTQPLAGNRRAGLRNPEALLFDMDPAPAKEALCPRKQNSV